MSDRHFLLFRADASRTIGTGHVMRCLALAQAWRDRGGRFAFVSHQLASGLAARITSEGGVIHTLSAPSGTLEDARITGQLASEHGAKWLVVDGYTFDDRYLEALELLFARVLLLDDSLGAGRHRANAILNQNIYAKQSSYRACSPGCLFLKGPRYALMRREFGRWQAWNREIGDIATKVLITLGGADKANFTLFVLRTLGDYRDRRLSIRVLVGPAYADVQSLLAAADHQHHEVQVVQNPDDVSVHLAWSDMLISAAGVTTLEASFMGLPSIVGVVADNQAPVAAEMSRRNLAVSLGPFESMNSDDLLQAAQRLINDRQTREAMSRGGRKLVDGRGANRVVRQLQAPAVSLRAANESDRQLIWRWANQPSVRQASFRSEQIDWEQHVKWFGQMIDTVASRMYIGMVEWKPVGLIRYTLREKTAEVSVSVDEREQGKGIGPLLIAAGSERIVADAQVGHIRAYVKRTNQASLHAFCAAGFEVVAEVKVGDQEAWLLERNLSSALAGKIPASPVFN